jgi:acetolactate synthase-1/2/3 large subunit
MSAGSHTSVGAVSGLADGLHAAGVRRLFGMPGGGPNLDMIGAAAERGIPFTLAHGETAACVMAGAFGLLTGTAGTAVVTRGPGLTSAINGAAQCMTDRAPLLLLSDRVPAGQRDRVAHQRLDQLAVSAAVTRWNGVLGHRDPAGTAAGAAALALGPPPGAVHLDYDPGLPGDRPPAPEPPPAPAGLDRALAVARARRRPVVVLGVDAVAHAAALRRVLDGAGVPVLTTYQAAGTLDADSPDAAGLFTNAALERPLLDAADLVVGVGLDPVEPVPAPWSCAAPTVLLSPVALDAAYFGEPAVVSGPPAETLAAVLAACAPDWPAGTGRRHRERGLAALADDGLDGGGLRPVDLVRAVHRWAGDAQLTVDAGAHMLAAMPFWPVRRPHGVLISNGLATMGYALPAAIGAALARPGERVVCLTGDGGLGMVLAELETLARLALPVTVVVFDDAALTLIELKQRAGQGDAAAVRFGPVDLAGVARATGVPAGTADDVTGAAAALRASGPGPFLLDARVDPTSYRHLLAVSRG